MQMKVTINSQHNAYSVVRCLCAMAGIPSDPLQDYEVTIEAPDLTPKPDSKDAEIAALKRQVSGLRCTVSSAIADLGQV